ncbi:MAG: ketosteroid isomerase-related protein [Novosphingobium sp.]|uniref:ketosteroid isomerase-related protein n=1 Tax=Novosphingobium sp. TaxID=1874826 RepID=UPI0032BF11C6
MDRAEALALLTRYYAAFNGGDWRGMLDCLSDDVAHDINQGETQRGKATFAAFLAHMERCYRERLDAIVLMASEDGTRGAAEFIVHGEYLCTDEGLPEANGQIYQLPAGAFFAFSDGKIDRVTVYYNLNDWCAQVGA